MSWQRRNEYGKNYFRQYLRPFAELLRKYEIDILPLHILLGDKEYGDGKNITPDQIYTWSDANKTTPKTSAPALADAMELFRPYAEAGREIVCFSISAVCPPLEM